MHKDATHFTMNIQKSMVKKLKKIARHKSFEEDREISASEIIRRAITTAYPDIFVEEIEKMDEIEGQTSL